MRWMETDGYAELLRDWLSIEQERRCARLGGWVGRLENRHTGLALLIVPLWVGELGMQVMGRSPHVCEFDGG